MTQLLTDEGKGLITVALNSAVGIAVGVAEGFAVGVNVGSGVDVRVGVFVGMVVGGLVGGGGAIILYASDWPHAPRSKGAAMLAALNPFLIVSLKLIS